MKAIAYTEILPTSEDFLVDVTLPDPGPPQGRDLLVRVEAVSVNPVDTKVRKRVDPQGAPKVLGYDAAGVVEAAGPEATLFKPGDRVYYAGAIDRPGTNAELHLVDERIVGRMPASLDFAAAAALPLTAITAWEALFDRMGIRQGETGGALLVVGGAGGVGSIAIQLARQLTGLAVIATASRAETRQWCLSLGAHHVVDHVGDLAAQVAALGLPVPYIFSTTATDRHWSALAEIVAPQGAIGLIDDPDAIDIRLVKRKSARICWEFMFARPVFQTPDMIAQHTLLNAVADLVDAGRVRSTRADLLGPIDAATLRKAHIAIESGRTIGKIVLAPFG